MAPPIKTDDYIKAVAYRRTVYGINDKLPAGVDDERIISIIGKIHQASPSSYNTQTGRVTILLGAPHKKLWDLVLEIGVPIVKQHAGEGAAGKMAGMWGAFKGAYGSILFWESGASMKAAQEKHQSAAHMFPEFGSQSDGMAQIQVWTALELEGLGVNAQHMGAIPPVEEALKKEFDIPADWSLRANLNFGGYAQDHPEMPAKMPLEETLSVRKS